MRSRAILKGGVSPFFFSVAVLGQLTLFQRPDIATGLLIPLNVYRYTLFLVYLSQDDVAFVSSPYCERCPCGWLMMISGAFLFLTCSALAVSGGWRCDFLCNHLARYSLLAAASWLQGIFGHIFSPHTLPPRWQASPRFLMLVFFPLIRKEPYHQVYSNFIEHFYALCEN